MSWLSNDSSFLGVDISKALHGMDTTTITEDIWKHNSTRDVTCVCYCHIFVCLVRKSLGWKLVNTMQCFDRTQYQRLHSVHIHNSFIEVPYVMHATI